MNRVNDAEYMKEQLKNHPNTAYLGNELRKDLNFIMEMVREPGFRDYWGLLRLVDKSLINQEFIISYLEAIYDKNNRRALYSSGNGNVVKLIRELLTSESIRGNKKLWDAIIKLGIADHEILEKKYVADYLIDYYKGRVIDMKNRIEEVTCEEFMEKTSEVWRDDFEFMLEVLTRNPSLYECLSKGLKENKEFEQLLISRNPESKEIINKYKKEQNKKEEQARIRKDEERSEMKRQEKERKQEELKEEYEKQGENHPNLILVKQFLGSNTSKKKFCEEHNISIKQLNNVIEEVSGVFPEIEEKVVEKNRQASAIHFSTVESINSKLLSGEITIEQYSRKFYKGKKISQLLSGTTNASERKQIHTLVIKAIASGELKMMDYVRLFSEASERKKEYNYDTVINCLNAYMRTAKVEVPELQGKGKPIGKANIQIRSLKKYSMPFRSKNFIGSKIGFKDSDGNIEMTTITEEHIEYVKKYLHLEDEYICDKTVNSALSKMIKGEITFEEIDKRMNKKISMKSAVTNAIEEGTGIDEVQEADSAIGNVEQTNTPTIDIE